MFSSVSTQLITQLGAPSSYRASPSSFRSCTTFWGLNGAVEYSEAAPADVGEIQALVGFVAW